MLIQDALKKFGLTETESEVFMSNLQLGTQAASVIARHLKMPRNTVRSILDNLYKKKLITKTTKGNTQLYTAIEPENILTILEMQKNKYMNDMKQKIKSIESIIPQLKGLAPQRVTLPKIQFFEGKEGICRTLDDSLDSKTEILTFSDVTGISKHIKEFNDYYAKERIENDIYERVLVLDNETGNKYFENYDISHTEVRVIPPEYFTYSVELNIYDDKISLVTFEENNFMGIIIENPQLYSTLKSIFEVAWENTKKIPSALKKKNKKPKKSDDSEHTYRL